ncbi:MAG TPA: hypothetical protein VGN63_07855 [Flavisolibacter sp.]|jgi:hypothetical protein|nr:hypothetical protein [Flavisolibacter sp.]
MGNEQKDNKSWWKSIKDDDRFFTEADEKIKAIEAKLDAYKAGSEDADEKRMKLLEGLIKHYLDLTRAIDVRRAEYFKAGLQMFAVSLAALGVIVKFIDFENHLFVSIITLAFVVGLISLLYTAISIITTFYWQTQSERYHFLKLDATKHPYLGNSWLWFYHGVPGLDKIPYIKKSTESSEESDYRDGAMGYLNGAEFYFRNFIDATDKEIFIQHLRYTYLLLVHNAYKNKFDRQLIDRISEGTKNTFGITGIALFLSFVIGSIVSSSENQNDRQETKQSFNNDSAASNEKSDSTSFLYNPSFPDLTRSKSDTSISKADSIKVKDSVQVQ